MVPEAVQPKEVLGVGERYNSRIKEKNLLERSRVKRVRFRSVAAEASVGDV